MKSVIIIGLGRFGGHLAKSFISSGQQVTVVDKDSVKVNRLKADAFNSVECDCSSISQVGAIDFTAFDACFICISHDLELSMFLTTTLKSLGAKKIIVKVSRDIHGQFLLKNGAAEVIYPEKDMAIRTAFKYSRKAVANYVEISKDYGIYEIVVPYQWVNHTISALDIGMHYNVNIIAYSINGNILPMTESDHSFSRDEKLIIAGTRRDLMRLMDKKH